MKTKIKNGVALFSLLSFVCCILISGCGSRGKDETKFLPAPTTSTISGQVLVPEGTPTEKAKSSILEFAKKFLVSKVFADINTKPLNGATVSVYRYIKKGEKWEKELVPINTTTTDSNGNYTLSNIPKEDNLIVCATKNTKDAQGNPKIVTVKGLVSIEDKDLGKIKTNVNINVGTTLLTIAVKEVAKQRNLNVKDIDKYQVEELKKVVAAAVISKMDQSKAVEIVTRDANLTEETQENKIKQELEALKREVIELAQKLNDLLTKGTIAVYIEGKISGVIITVSGGRLPTGETKTCVTNDYGWCYITVEGTTPNNPYTVTARKAGYKEVKNENVVVLASQTFGVSFTMSLATTLNDEEQIRTNFAVAVNAYNNKDITTLMFYFSLNFLDDGWNYHSVKADFERQFADPNFELASYTIDSITVSGDKATMKLTWGDGRTDTMYWIKENNIWKLYGNQKRVGVRVSVRREYPENYYLEISIRSITGITSVQLTGPNIGQQWWHPQVQHLTVSLFHRPNIEDTYTITISLSDGTFEKEKYSVTGVNDNFAWITSPVNGSTVNTLTPIITWKEANNIRYYHLTVRDDQGNSLWRVSFPRGTTSTVYNFNGTATAPLQSRKTYTIFLSTIDENGNQAITKSTFTVQIGGKLKISTLPHKKTYFYAPMKLVTLTYITVKQKIISTELSFWQGMKS